VKKVVDAVHSNKDLWKSTAIVITVDEGGGYYDPGHVQPSISSAMARGFF
jgi:phospholipase C